MKKLLCLFSLAFSLLPFAFSEDTIPVFQWDVETSRPVSQKLPLYHGETINLQPRFLSYGAPLTLSNVTAVVLQYRTSTMAAGLYYPKTGSVVSASSGRVNVTWDPACEGTNSLYTYNVTLYSASGSVYRCLGTITIASSTAGSPALVPAAAYATPADLAAQAAATSNGVLAAVTALGYGTGNVSLAYVNAQDTAVSNAAVSLVSGINTNLAITIPGSGTNWLCYTNGLLKSVQTSDVWQLVSNGTFENEMTGWTTNDLVGKCTWVFDGDTATATGPLGPPRGGSLSQNIAIAEGHTYRIAWTWTASSPAATITPYVGGQIGSLETTQGQRSQDIVAGSSTNIALKLLPGDSGQTISIDNVTLYDVTP